MADLSFAFNGNEPDAMRKRRAVADAMMGQGVPQATDVGSGLAALGNALAYRQQQRGPFPDATGGVQAGIGARIGNFLGLNRGGLS